MESGPWTVVPSTSATLSPGSNGAPSSSATISDNSHSRPSMVDRLNFHKRYNLRTRFSGRNGAPSAGRAAHYTAPHGTAGSHPTPSSFTDAVEGGSSSGGCDLIASESPSSPGEPVLSATASVMDSLRQADETDSSSHDFDPGSAPLIDPNAIFPGRTLGVAPTSASLASNVGVKSSTSALDIADHPISVSLRAARRAVSEHEHRRVLFEGDSDDNDPDDENGQHLRDIVRAAEAKHYAHLNPEQLGILVFHETAAASVQKPASAPKRLRYLPLCPARVVGAQGVATNELTILPSHRDRIARANESQNTHGPTWLSNTVPTEIFDLITRYLARDDMKSMRLVNHEFEQKVSRALFYTSVVPFNTEIYDMIDEGMKIVGREPETGKGKGRAKGKGKTNTTSEIDTDSGGLHWQNAMDDKDGKVYKGHGLRVFQGFGPYIKRFGMSFEVSEQQLTHPPMKKDLESFETYYGCYTWPPPQYARFSNLAGLESAADETSRMRMALSNLTMVQELALSIDSGLGWLNGPDKSFHARLFNRQSSVFGKAGDVPDHATQEAREFWTTLQQCSRSLGDISRGELVPEYHHFQSTPARIGGLSSTKFANTDLWSSINQSRLAPAIPSFPKGPYGLLTLTPADAVTRDKHRDARPNEIVPAALQREQKEWLMEAEWAQRAFLESYMLAVADNPTNFTQVTTLKFAKISSRYLSMLARDSFWNALPNLKNVTLHVSADWRTVEKDTAGSADVQPKEPSDALHPLYYDLLCGRVAPRKSIKTLDLGWCGGGEHAEGMFARNAHLLPAPITDLDHCIENPTEDGLNLPFVEHLTLTNCWVTPTTLEQFVRRHADKALTKLTLDSVSLTALPPGSEHLATTSDVPAAGAPGSQWLAGAQAPVPPPMIAPAGPATLAAWQNFSNYNQAGVPALPPQAGLPPPPLGTLATLPPPPPPPPPMHNVAHSHSLGLPRRGSWPHLLTILFPNHDPVHNPADDSDDGTISSVRRKKKQRQKAPSPARKPSPHSILHTLELKSCGYARLEAITVRDFDQSAFNVRPSFAPPMRQQNLDNPPRSQDVIMLPHGGAQLIGGGYESEDDEITAEQNANRRSLCSGSFFRLRYLVLKPLMLDLGQETYMGTIVQQMPLRELDCLFFDWGLLDGWKDKEKAQEAVFDGFLPGGCGRISGVVEGSGRARFDRWEE